MSPIAEITPTQLGIMLEVSGHMPSFILGLPKDDDNEEHRSSLATVNADTEALVSLGFLEEVTSHARGLMELMDKTSERKNRVFHITKIGLALFTQASPLVN